MLVISLGNQLSRQTFLIDKNLDVNNVAEMHQVQNNGTNSAISALVSH